MSRKHDALRLLWVKDPFKDELHLVKLQYTRVVFGVLCSPFLLNATLQDHLEKFHTSNPELVDTLSQSMYVDDVIVGADTRVPKRHWPMVHSTCGNLSRISNHCRMT